MCDVLCDACVIAVIAKRKRQRALASRVQSSASESPETRNSFTEKSPNPTAAVAPSGDSATAVGFPEMGVVDTTPDFFISTAPCDMEYTERRERRESGEKDGEKLVDFCSHCVIYLPASALCSFRSVKQLHLRKVGKRLNTKEFVLSFPLAPCSSGTARFRLRSR